jgi:protein-S-isoprenylcysteine O-methyltransferase Ste14
VRLLAASLLVFWRGHADLGLNWSPSLEIRAHHELVTRGIYRHVRHPMYASLLLWALAQPLLLHNYIVGLVGPVTFAAFYALRVGPEERMMLDTFGDRYREYMQRTGRVLPRLRRR